jgi:hypothetical protein
VGDRQGKYSSMPAVTSAHATQASDRVAGWMLPVVYEIAGGAADDTGSGEPDFCMHFD